MIIEINCHSKEITNFASKITKMKYLVLLLIAFAFGCGEKKGDNKTQPTDAQNATTNTNTATEQKTTQTVENTKSGFKPYIVDSTKVKTTKSGLKYIIVEEGTGNVPKKGEKVIANYHGMLTDGSVFDSSFDRGQPFEFNVGQNQVIKGWDEGFQLFKVGTRARLIIPSELGYGAQGSPPKIPGGATLWFDVQLLATTP